MTSNSWRTTNLEDIAELTVGHVGNMASEYTDTGVPFLRSLNVEPFNVTTKDLKFISHAFHTRLVKSALQPGDIVIVRTGKPGACAIIPEWLPEANCSDLIIVRPRAAVNNQFLAYYINAVAGSHVSAHLVGAVQQHFNVASARKIPVLLPPLCEQRAIASILGALDDKIELNQRMNTTLDAMARAIFQSWFVDFDPVRAKTEGQETELPAEIAALFPDEFVESQLGKIPEGWQVDAISAIARVTRDAINPTASRNSIFEHYSIPAFDEGKAPKLECGEAIKSLKYRVPPNSILLSKLNPSIPRVWYPRIKSQHSAICSTEFLVAEPRNGFPREFLYGIFCSNSFKTVFASLATGTSGSHQRVRHESMLNINTIIPPGSLSQQYSKLVEPILERISQSMDEILTVAASRDALLPKIISGQLRVPQAENLL